jgi:hypothetical protein
MHGTSNQIDNQEQQDGAKPPGMVHVEEVEKVQHLVQVNPVSLDIFCASGILCDHRADDRKDGNQNEERNGEFEGAEKVIDNGKKTTFFHFHRVF